MKWDSHALCDFPHVEYGSTRGREESVSSLCIRPHAKPHPAPFNARDAGPADPAVRPDPEPRRGHTRDFRRHAPDVAAPELRSRAPQSGGTSGTWTGSHRRIPSENHSARKNTRARRSESCRAADAKAWSCLVPGTYDDIATDAERPATERSASRCPECDVDPHSPHAPGCPLRPATSMQDYFREHYACGNASVLRVAGRYADTEPLLER